VKVFFLTLDLETSWQWVRWWWHPYYRRAWYRSSFLMRSGTERLQCSLLVSQSRY
jgi:hypothetical protein